MRKLVGLLPSSHWKVGGYLPLSRGNIPVAFKKKFPLYYYRKLRLFSFIGREKGLRILFLWAMFNQSPAVVVFNRVWRKTKQKSQRLGRKPWERLKTGNWNGWVASTAISSWWDGQKDLKKCGDGGRSDHLLCSQDCLCGEFSEDWFRWNHNWIMSLHILAVWGQHMFSIC